LVKFLHIGDVHLDTSFYSKNKVLRKKLREGIRKAFNNAIDLCIEEKVDALLIAGDLFDNDKLSFKTEQFLIKEFTRLREHNIKVFYATGNHDPGHISYRANSIRWPDNVHVFKEDRVETAYIYNSDNKAVCKIVSCGHKTSTEGRNLVLHFPIKEENLPHVGLLHTMVTSAGGVQDHDRYLPCSREDLESKMYDYWALGHIHKRQKISENCEIYYPGNIQGRHPRETGEKGGLLVTIDELGSITTEFKPLSAIQWQTLALDGLEDIKSYDELKEYIKNNIEKYVEQNGLPDSDLILRVELQGRAYLKRELQLEDNIDQLTEDLILDLNLLNLEIKVDNLMNVLNIENYREGDHVLSSVLCLLDNIEENRELIERLMEIPLANKRIRKKDDKLSYFKELANGLDEEAVSLMVGDVDEDI